MKRRKFHAFFIILLLLTLNACRKNTQLYLPSITTIVKGTVIDENNRPVEGWGFSFGGYTGNYPPISTFGEDTKTDKDGNYFYSVGIPQTTVLLEFVSVGFLSNDKLGRRTANYSLFYEKNGVYQQNIRQAGPYIGETNIFNFQIKKK